MKKFLLLTAIASAVSVAAVAPAMAVDAPTNTFTVGSTTNKLCQQPVASNISLPDYDGTAAVTASTPITYKCTNTTTSTIAVASLNGNKLKNGANTIDYTSTVGATTPGSGVNASATPISVLFTANVAADQAPIPATTPYTDTLTITVSY